MGPVQIKGRPHSCGYYNTPITPARPSLSGFIILYSHALMSPISLPGTLGFTLIVWEN